MSWNDLSMADRARYIQLGVSNGVTDLSSIRATYNSYAEGGSIIKGVMNALASGDFQSLRRQLNRVITDEQVVDNYMDNVMYTMENPNKRGFDGERWHTYKDKDIKGNTHINYGPGIESHSDIGATLNYKSNRGYTTEELNSRIRPDLMNKMAEIRKDLREMYGDDADTMSLGNREILLDIAHNVSPRGKNRGNMPKAWPKLVSGMMTGNSKKVKSNVDSGNKRRANMRTQLMWKDSVDKNTVKNE